mmetsp:Transcript_32153/g.46839  ORF Transcript_32153/g.46839 Transcript_32153/m.46839 type:complete len:565 (-) Transcript_32153:72-1766(-)
MTTACKYANSEIFEHSKLTSMYDKNGTTNNDVTRVTNLQKKIKSARFLISAAMLVMTMIFATAFFKNNTNNNNEEMPQQQEQKRRLSEEEEVGPITAALHKAQGEGEDSFKVLFLITTLSEYDTGTRGTTANSDRLARVLLPILTSGVSSMIDRGWQVDVYLVLGYKELKPERRQMIVDALPDGVGLEVWEDAMPLYYKRKRLAQREPEKDQVLELASHGLSRQHRYVVKDKLYEYDFFACFEDDMRVTSDHMMNFLEMSSQIESLIHTAEKNQDEKAHVKNESTRDGSTRETPSDNAPVGNDVVDDPLTIQALKRVIPGFLRVEALDDRFESHQLRNGVLDEFTFKEKVPAHPEYGSSSASNWIDPNVCCAEDEPGRGIMKPNPVSNDIILWETNIGAAGVRKYPEPLGWMGAMPVQDIADVGSFWSGFGNIFGDALKSRPRRVDQTLGQQAGFMATRSQILFFDEICPGGFLPPYEDDQQWKGDSLQRHAVEFWSGGFQLFGQCLLNRVLSLDPKRFERQLLYHTANNKQRTKGKKLFVRANDFLGQLHTVKERAEKSIGVE